MCVCVCACVCVTLFHSFTLSLSLSHSLSLSLSLSLTHTHSLSLSLSLFISISLVCHLVNPELSFKSDNDKQDVRVASLALRDNSGVPLKRLELERVNDHTQLRGVNGGEENVL